MAQLFSEANVRLVLRTLLRLGAPAKEVEDLGQEVFLVVHKRAREFDSSRRVEPWLYGIARNVMRAHWRKVAQAREELGTSGDVAGEELAMEAVEPGSDEVGQLRQAVSRLPEPLLDVLMLRDFMGMTLVEAAEELSIPTDTAKDRLRRARDEVKRHVAKLDSEVRCG